MYPRQVFTTAEAVEASGQPAPQVFKQLSYLRRQGYLQQVRRGLYLVVPLEARGPHPPPPNPYLLASKLASPYVLAYHTALELHGVAQSTFYAVYVATPKRFRTFTHHGMKYQAVRASLREVQEAATTTSIHDQPVKVTSREWTVAHCAARLDLAGGLEEFLKSVSSFAYVRPDPLAAAASELGRKGLYNRLGFVLELFQNRWHVSETDLDKFRAKLSRSADYFGTRPGRAKYVKAWNLMVPDNLDQVMRPG